MHSFKCILAGHYPVKSMSEKEREHVDLPPLTFLPLLFIKTLKFLEQLRTIISRDGEIATEKRSNLCRQHFSTAKKTDQGGGILSLLEKNFSLFRVTKVKRKEREREFYFIFTISFISSIFTYSLAYWKLEIVEFWIDLTFQSNT